MRIRYGTISDLDQLAEVEAICFPKEEAASRESIERRLNAFPMHFWVMEEEGKIISFVDGMVTAEPDLTDEMYENEGLHTETGDWQMIFGVNTLPEYRKRGYAGMLLKRAIEDAGKQGRKGLVLTCKKELLHYYASFGFLEEGLSRSTHGGAVWYQMRLTL